MSDNLVRVELTIAGGGRRKTYRLVPVHPDPLSDQDKVFFLHGPGGEEHKVVQLRAPRRDGRYQLCGCDAWKYDRTKRCKHLSALRAAGVLDRLVESIDVAGNTSGSPGPGLAAAGQ